LPPYNRCAQEAARTDGSLASWGQNNGGQLGDASTSERDHPVLVDQSTGLTSVAGSCLRVGAVQAASTSCTGGVKVTLTGQGFLGATSVKFGNTAATSFQVVNDQRIDAVSPTTNPGATDITVTTPRGTSAATAAGIFTCATPPTLPQAGGGLPQSPIPWLALLALAMMIAAAAAVHLKTRAVPLD
jgi:IPT/TIG domain/Regulator of chromosome condensation (RCC1) repeat